MRIYSTLLIPSDRVTVVKRSLQGYEAQLLLHLAFTDGGIIGDLSRECLYHRPEGGLLLQLCFADGGITGGLQRKKIRGKVAPPALLF